MLADRGMSQETRVADGTPGPGTGRPGRPHGSAGWREQEAASHDPGRASASLGDASGTVQLGRDMETIGRGLDDGLVSEETLAAPGAHPEPHAGRPELGARARLFQPAREPDRRRLYADQAGGRRLGTTAEGPVAACGTSPWKRRPWNTATWCAATSRPWIRLRRHGCRTERSPPGTGGHAMSAPGAGCRGGDPGRCGGPCAPGGNPAGPVRAAQDETATGDPAGTSAAGTEPPSQVDSWTCGDGYRTGPPAVPGQPEPGREPAGGTGTASVLAAGTGDPAHRAGPAQGGSRRGRASCREALAGQPRNPALWRELAGSQLALDQPDSARSAVDRSSPPAPTAAARPWWASRSAVQAAERPRWRWP